MAPKIEFVGTVQFWPNGARGNPVALFMEMLESGECRIGARLPEWRQIAGIGPTVNKAAGNYELALKAAVPDEGAYEGPYWNAGIKAEKPAPPKPPAAAPSTAGGGPRPAEPGIPTPPAPSITGGGSADASPVPTGPPPAPAPSSS